MRFNSWRAALELRGRSFVLIAGIVAILGALCGASYVVAAPIMFTGTSGDLAASVQFDMSGSNLVVTLRNTSSADVIEQPKILTSVFFEVSGGSLLSLTPATGSAVLAPGSTVLFGSTDPGNVVGGEWAYLEGIGGQTPNGARYGISSSGFGIFGSASFPGSNLEGPSAVDGVQYGITSAGDNPATGQSAVTGDNALIQNGVVFTLPGLPANFDPSQRISNVLFQYGTALTPTDPSVPGTPEPSALAIAAIAMIFTMKRPGESRKHKV